MGTIVDPRNDPDALTVSIGDSYNTLEAMLSTLAAHRYVISYASPTQEPIDVSVIEIGRDPDDDDTFPIIVGRLWRDDSDSTKEVVRLPLAGAAIHIY